MRATRSAEKLNKIRAMREEVEKQNIQQQIEEFEKLIRADKDEEVKAKLAEMSRETLALFALCFDVDDVDEDKELEDTNELRYWIFEWISY